MIYQQESTLWIFRISFHVIEWRRVSMIHIRVNSKNTVLVLVIHSVNIDRTIENIEIIMNSEWCLCSIVPNKFLISGSHKFNSDANRDNIGVPNFGNPIVSRVQNESSYSALQRRPQKGKHEHPRGDSTNLYDFGSHEYHDELFPILFILSCVL